jgi:predicted nicotinamide N-methyase
MAAGLDVTFSDQSPAAVQMAEDNAARNGFPNAPGLVFGWEQPPVDSGTWDLLFGSDILYDRSAHRPLLTTLQQLLAAGWNRLDWRCRPGQRSGVCGVCNRRWLERSSL